MPLTTPFTRRLRWLLGIVALIVLVSVIALPRPMGVVTPALSSASPLARLNVEVPPSVKDMIHLPTKVARITAPPSVEDMIALLAQPTTFTTLDDINAVCD